MTTLSPAQRRVVEQMMADERKTLTIADYGHAFIDPCGPQVLVSIATARVLVTIPGLFELSKSYHIGNSEHKVYTLNRPVAEQMLGGEK
jgi:hypothetical protein